MKKQFLKILRKSFRENVFSRDNNKCKICSSKSNLDAHHITDRHLLINDGYVISNGITLCDICHLKAEKFHMTDGVSWEKGFHPVDLYKIINSSIELVNLDLLKQ